MLRENAEPAGAPVRWEEGILLGRGCATSLESVRQVLAAPVFGAGAGADFRPEKAVMVHDGGRVRRLLMACVCCLEPRSETFTTGQGTP